VTHTFFALATNGGSASKNLTVIAAPTPVPPVPTPTAPGTPTILATRFLLQPLRLLGPARSHNTIWQSHKAPYGTSDVVFDSGVLNGALVLTVRQAISTLASSTLEHAGPQ